MRTRTMCCLSFSCAILSCLLSIAFVFYFISCVVFCSIVLCSILLCCAAVCCLVLSFVRSDVFCCVIWCCCMLCCVVLCRDASSRLFLSCLDQRLDSFPQNRNDMKNASQTVNGFWSRDYGWGSGAGLVLTDSISVSSCETWARRIRVRVRVAEMKESKNEETDTFQIANKYGARMRRYAPLWRYLPWLNFVPSQCSQVSPSRLLPAPALSACKYWWFTRIRCRSEGGGIIGGAQRSLHAT
jgi:hypothetical protein